LIFCSPVFCSFLLCISSFLSPPIFLHFSSPSWFCRLLGIYRDQYSSPSA
jgi:hypothetical protein